ncbi:transcription termination factor 5, mitochondrial [Ochlerotatus camptorhynchus]|uniref:transcription termination factor 5, mitochondrial n=1 Tax=Ochlerotatus camptorhynchus TaxID=644619 RepID=UPI0031DFE185
MYKLRILQKNQRNLNRLFCSEARFTNINEATQFFYPLLDVNESTMYKYLAKHSYLVNMEPVDVRRKVAYFRYLNATNDEILEQPMLFSLHLITIENRSTILRECGLVESLNLVAISKYITIIRQQIKALKNNKLIPIDLNMMDQLKKQFDTEVNPNINYSDEMHLQTLRELFLNAFLRERLKLTDEEFKKLWKSYSKIKHKSFGHTQRVVDILQHNLKLTREKIVGNLYLLHSDPENLLRYPEVVPTIAGMDIKEVMVKQPKVMMVPCDKLKQLLGHLREFGIDEAGVLKYSTILTLSPNTVLARLEQLKKTKEFEVLSKHPRITKLIAYQTKAAIRLDFLQQLKVRCASLNVLSSHSQSFEKYVREGYDRTNGKDIAHYLNMVFQQQGTDAVEQLKRHPNWFHVPAVQMQETLDYLRSKEFSLDEIYENVQILLYPLSRISQKLDKLIECKQTKKRHEDFGIELTCVTPAQMLSLCLYMIELDFHFTGDGIWPDQVQHSDSSTTTNIELPKSLNKDYKYGKKSSMSICV